MGGVKAAGMSVGLRPPALILPETAAVRWTSFVKAIREPEVNWPAQILERPVIAAAVGGRVMALVADPEAARTILAGSEEDFPKWRIYDRVVSRGVGRNSLSGLEGERWRAQRRVFGAFFRPERLAASAPAYRNAAARAVDGWAAVGGEVRLDAGLEMTRITLDAIWRIVFGTRFDQSCPALISVAGLVYAALQRGDLDEASRRLDALARAPLGEARREGGAAGNPFVRLGSGEGAGAPDTLSESELFDNARLFLRAGQETTSLTLTWALWLVGQDLETQGRVREEIDEVAGAGPIEPEHVERLVFTGQVLHEVMRLYPLPVVVRQARHELVVAGERLPPGSILAVCIYALHRHRGLWEDPDAFRPDRFQPGSPEPRHRFAYLPFGAGRHSCVAATLGWAEAVTVLATILKSFRVRTDLAVPVRPRMAITLRPDRETAIVLQPR